MLQPLDLGIIQKFTVHYGHFLLVLSKIDECGSATATDVIKSVKMY